MDICGCTKARRTETDMGGYLMEENQNGASYERIGIGLALRDVALSAMIPGMGDLAVLHSDLGGKI